MNPLSILTNPRVWSILGIITTTGFMQNWSKLYVFAWAAGSALHRQLLGKAPAVVATPLSVILSALIVSVSRDVQVAAYFDTMVYVLGGIVLVAEGVQSVRLVMYGSRRFLDRHTLGDTKKAFVLLISVALLVSSVAQAYCILATEKTSAHPSPLVIYACLVLVIVEIYLSYLVEDGNILDGAAVSWLSFACLTSSYLTITWSFEPANLLHLLVALGWPMMCFHTIFVDIRPDIPWSHLQTLETGAFVSMAMSVCSLSFVALVFEFATDESMQYFYSILRSLEAILILGVYVTEMIFSQGN